MQMRFLMKDYFSFQQFYLKKGKNSCLSVSLCVFFEVWQVLCQIHFVSWSLLRTLADKMILKFTVTVLKWTFNGFFFWIRKMLFLFCHSNLSDDFWWQITTLSSNFFRKKGKKFVGGNSCLSVSLYVFFKVLKWNYNGNFHFEFEKSASCFTLSNLLLLLFFLILPFVHPLTLDCISFSCTLRCPDKLSDTS